MNPILQAQQSPKNITIDVCCAEAIIMIFSSKYYWSTWNTFLRLQLRNIITPCVRFDILLHPFHLICFSSWRIMTPHYLVFALLEHGNHDPSPLQHSFGLFSSQPRYITNTTILPSPHFLIDSQAEYAHPTGVFIFTAQWSNRPGELLYQSGLHFCS